MARKKPSSKAKPRKPAAGAMTGQRFPACRACGSRDIEKVTERNYECRSCNSIGEPMHFSSYEQYLQFKKEADLEHAAQLKLWGRKVIYHTIPVVVLVNWLTAIYFATFFILGMLGSFRDAAFQMLFLYSSIAVVVLGFCIIARFGKESVNI